MGNDAPRTPSTVKGYDEMLFRCLFSLAVAATFTCVSPRCFADVEVLASGYNPDGALLSGLVETIDRMVGEDSELFQGESVIELVARQSEKDIELLMTLVDRENGRSFEETRTVSRASCLAQARAMARQLFRTRAQPTVQEEDTPTAHNKEHEQIVLDEHGWTVVSPEDYKRSRVLALALAPMSVMILTGSILAVGAATWADHRTAKGYLISGSAIGIFGMVMGPAPAYYKLDLTQRAFLMMFLRLGIVGTSGLFIFLQHRLIDNQDREINNSGNCGGTYAPLVAAIITYAGGLAIGFIDAAFAGKAADRANLAAGKKASPEVSLLPSVFSHRKKTTMGFSLTISF